MIHEVTIKPKTPGKKYGIAGEVFYEGEYWTITKSNECYPSRSLPSNREMVNTVLSDSHFLTYRYDDTMLSADKTEAEKGILIYGQEHIRKCIALWKIHIQMIIKGGHNSFCTDPMFILEDKSDTTNYDVDIMEKQLSVLMKLKKMDYEEKKKVIYLYAPMMAHGTHNEIYLRLGNFKSGILMQPAPEGVGPSFFCAMDDFLKNYKLDDMTEKRIVLNQAKQFKVINNHPGHGFEYEGTAIGITDEHVLSYFIQYPQVFDYIKERVDEAAKGFDDMKKKQVGTAQIGDETMTAFKEDQELDKLRTKGEALKIRQADRMGITKVKERIAEAEGVYADARALGLTMLPEEKFVDQFANRVKQMKDERAAAAGGMKEATNTQATGDFQKDIAEKSVSMIAEDLPK